ncbi:MAG: copper resistance protein CopD [Pseudomonas sp.]|jgi:putative copper resistance protein D|uniref:copper homeostasis membrane protein CopD n=1 Tax=Pseudomonas sp. TaxID=306 RepID=UPI0026274F48|nr:copper homeostasis membrane protein CopD [Pseudomonas sp.]MDB6052297.1 copper resistance protein CopD [Pseudomonas sp.]
MQNALILCRFVHFAAVLLLFGTCLFRTWLFRSLLSTPDAETPGTPALDTRLLWILRGLNALALISGLLLLVLIAGSMANNWQDGLDPSTLTLVLGDTFFGRVWSGHLLLNLLLTISLVLTRYFSPPLRLVLAALFLATLAPIGHGAMFDGSLGDMMMVNQLIHLCCVGAWLGGLLLLWLLLSSGAQGNLKPVLLRFSGIGYGLVAVIIATGLINVRVMSGAVWPEPAFSGFGLILLIKVGLVLCMLLLALFNRLQLNSQGNTLGILRTSVAIECLFGLAAVAAVSLLGTLPPLPNA